jgi:uncharacterized protein YndB with AHSA1/START domain
MTNTIRNSVFINRPVNDVFDFVTDPTTTPQWQANLVRSEVLTAGPMRLGTRVLEVRRIGKSEMQAEWEVTAYEPPTRRGYVYPAGFGPIRQQGISTFEPAEGGTQLSFTAQIEASFPFNLLLPLLARVMQQQNDKSFAILKRVLETHPASSMKNIVQGISR